MIGNAQDATLARMGKARVLAEGTSRIAYLINGVVYKRELYGVGDNLAEYENAKRIRRLSHPLVTAPDTALFDDIIAMEYVTGEGRGFCFDCEFGKPCQHGNCMPREHAEVIWDFGILDVHDENVIWNGSRYVIIDCVS